MKSRIPFAFPLVISACWNQSISLNKSFAPIHDVAVQVTSSPSSPGEVEIQLMTSKYQELGMCAVIDGGPVAPNRCQPTSAEYLPGIRQGSFGVFGFLRSFRPEAGTRFIVVDSLSGNTVRQFRLVDRGGNPLTVGLASIDRGVLEQELSYLASDQFNGRLAATKDHESAADFIVGNLEKLGIQPIPGRDYRQPFTMTKGPLSGRKTHNIVAMIEGSDPVLRDEYVVLGAHLDHAGTMSLGYTCSFGAGNDPICNGADDNGSGTIAILNTAKALAAVRGKLKRSVIIMWFSGEEEGLLGSKHWVSDPWIPLRKTVYMVNVDMVGYMESNGKKLLALGGGTSEAGRRILAAAGARYPDMKVSISDRAGGGSDHVPFMNEGIPGVFFNTGVSNNKNYHKTSDHAELIDYDGLHTATRIVFETVLEVSRSTTTKSPGSPVGYEGYEGYDGYVDGFTGGDYRPSLVTPEELEQTCHHLIQNPYLRGIH